MPVQKWVKLKVARVRGATHGVLPHTLLCQLYLKRKIMAVDPRTQPKELGGAADALYGVAELNHEVAWT